MIIRPYKEKDFPGIVEVIQDTDKTDCWPRVFPEGWSEERIREEFRPVKNYKDSCFLIAENNCEIIGLIAGHDLASFVDNEIPHLRQKFQDLDLLDSYYQRDLIVHPNWQRGLVGVKLFRALRQEAKQRGYENLVTRTPPLNTRGLRFFEGIGYQEIFRDDKPERVYFVRGF